MAFLDYVTEVKPILQIPATKDIIGQMCTDAVCEKVERYTGQIFKTRTILIDIKVAEDLTIYKVGPYFKPPYFPVSEVKIGSLVQERKGETLFFIDPPDPPYTITIICGHATVPDDIKVATLRAIQHQYQLMTSRAGAVQTSGLDGGPTVAYTFDLPLDVLQTLKTWRVVF